jgi:heme-degrading monooxygenase HmoA
MPDANGIAGEALSVENGNPAAKKRTQMRKSMAMIAVIFESWPTNAQKYFYMGEALRAHLQTLDGFISIERFRRVSDPAKLVALSFWRDEAAIETWRNNEAPSLHSGEEPAGSLSRLSASGGCSAARLRNVRARSGAPRQRRST